MIVLPNHFGVAPQTNAAELGVNGVRLSLTTRDRNPYRTGGWRVSAEELAALLGRERNVIEIEL